MRTLPPPAPAVGYVSLSGIPPASDCRRDLRRSSRPNHHPHPPVKKTACGTCGRGQRGWYDRKRHRVRDLACGFGGRPVPILTKPYSADRLRQVIEEVVARDV